MHVRMLPVLGLLAISSLVSTSGGCMPRVLVRPHPSPTDKGIRYYRPKPYLKVEPAEVAIDKSRSEIVPGLVRVSLAYLPDFSEEYAIDVRPGFGIANVDIKLEDGWNLTEIGQELDSQTDENLEAVGSILSAIGDVVPTASQQATASQHAFTVTARNVPIGFYESIIGRDARGCKRLYGFRYVGFVPFATCPLDMGGSQQNCCNAAENNLYGLTFIDGQMVFQSLTEMSTISPAAIDNAHSRPSETSADTSVERVGASGQALDLDQLSIQLRSFLNERFSGIGEVRVHRESRIQPVGIDLFVDVQRSNATVIELRQAAEQWLAVNTEASTAFDLKLIDLSSGLPLESAAAVGQ